MGFILDCTILLLAAAILVAVAARRLQLSYAVGLVVAGFGLTRTGKGIALTHELILDVILPLLLFEAAINIHWKKLCHDALPVITLTILGVLIAATDSVAVKFKDTGVLDTSGYMMASPFIFVAVAALAGRLAGSLSRKPLFLFGFASLALRGVLYTLGHNPFYRITVQCMDGLGAGIFAVESVLIIADLTRGAGRFNLAQRAIGTAAGVGMFLSNSVGAVAKHVGPNVAFLMPAAIAAGQMA